MFVGHFGLGLAGKRLAPRLSLGSLFLAAQLVDLLWPTFLLLGWESVRIVPGTTVVTPLDFVSYPWTHSLLLALAWGLALALIARLLGRSPGEAGLLAALVVSHWLLDLATHRPDLPLWPGGPKVGYELWASLPGTVIVELALFAAGVALYARSTRARDGRGRWGLVALVGFLLAIYAANLFGPPPPSEQAIAWAGQAQWLLVAWAYWLDRHRSPRKALAP